MGYLERLGILYLPTCVGLRYGHPVIYLEAFLVSVESPASVPFDLGIASQSGNYFPACGFAYRPSYSLTPGHPMPGQAILLRSPFALTERYGNVDPFPIVYAFRPRLRGRLTLSGLTFLRKP